MSPIIPPAGLHSSPNRSSNGLARKIGSGEAAPIRNPGRAGDFNQPLLPGVRATGGHVVERVGSDVTASFIPLRSELAGDPAQNFTERLECLRFVGLRHAQQFGGVHAQVSEQASRVSGEVCRDCGC